MGGAWCNSSATWLCCLAYWGGTVRAGTLEMKMTSASSLVSCARIPHPHQPRIKHLSFVSGFCPLPTSTLSVFKLSAFQAAPPPEFYLRGGCVSKHHTSETLAAWTCSNSLGQGVPEQWLDAGLSQKTFMLSHSGRGPEFMANHITEPVSGFATFRQFQYQSTWLLSGVCWDFCSWEAI